MSATADFLAADLGASNGRVLVARWNAERFDLDVVHRFPNGPVTVLGRDYWNVLRLWDEIKSGLARYAATTDSAPAGIGIDTWGVDYGLLDSAGNLLGNPVHYRDARTNEMMDAVFARIPRAEIFEITGLQFIQLNTLFQLYSMRHEQDPQLDYAARLLMMPDLLTYWLTGHQFAEYTIASTTQLLNARTRQWAGDLLTQLQLPVDILPEIVEPGTVVGPLLPQLISEAGLPEGGQVIAVGGHDTASAVAAVPALDRASVYISSGTWSLMGIEVPHPIISPQVEAYNFTNEGGVGNTIRLLKNITGLWLVQECRNQWLRGGEAYDWAELMDLAAAARPFQSIVYPDHPDFFHNPQDMIGAIRRYCQRTAQPEPDSPGQLIRCCLESLALRYRSVLDNLEELAGYPLSAIRVVGGGSQNRLLNQFTADACQRLVVAGPAEATALGNVMLQAIATGHLANVAEGRAAIAASVTLEEFSPQPIGGWDEAFGRFQALAALA